MAKFGEVKRNWRKVYRAGRRQTQGASFESAGRVVTFKARVTRRMSTSFPSGGKPRATGAGYTADVCTLKATRHGSRLKRCAEGTGSTPTRAIKAGMRNLANKL